MTEAEWLAGETLSRPRLGFLRRSKVSNRKFRLFATACSRRVWHVMSEPDCRSAVEMAERFADGLVTGTEMAEAHEKAWASPGLKREWGSSSNEERYANLAGSGTALKRDDERSWWSWAAAVVSHAENACLATRVEEREAQTLLLLREMVGNPFRPVTLDRSLLTPSVASLAEAAYEHRGLPSGHLDTVRLAVLSDALEEAGVAGEILEHLRSPGPHVRGCWAVDLVLGRS
jgi:hypothetical protein